METNLMLMTATYEVIHPCKYYHKGQKEKKRLTSHSENTKLEHPWTNTNYLLAHFSIV